MVRRAALAALALAALLSLAAAQRSCEHAGRVVAVSEVGVTIEANTSAERPSGRIVTEPVNLTWRDPPGSMIRAASVGQGAVLTASCDSRGDGIVREGLSLTLSGDDGVARYAFLVLGQDRRLPDVGGASVAIGEASSLEDCTECCCPGEHTVRLLRDGAAVASKPLRTGQSLCAEGLQVRLVEATVYGAEGRSCPGGAECSSRAELVVGAFQPEACAVEDMLFEVDDITSRLDDPIVERALRRSRDEAFSLLAAGEFARARETAEGALSRARRLDTKAHAVNVTAAVLAAVGLVVIAYVWLNRERRNKPDIF